MLTFPAQLVLGPLEFLAGHLRRRLLPLQSAQIVLHPLGSNSPPQKAHEHSDQQSRNSNDDDSPCHELAPPTPFSAAAAWRYALILPIPAPSWSPEPGFLGER